MAPYRPNPVGIQECCVYQFKGTNVFQWGEKRTAGFWHMVGPLIVLNDGPLVHSPDEHPAINEGAALGRITALWRAAGRGRDDLDDKFCEAVVDLMVQVYDEGYKHGARCERD